MTPEPTDKELREFAERVRDNARPLPGYWDSLKVIAVFMLRLDRRIRDLEVTRP